MSADTEKEDVYVAAEPESAKLPSEVFQAELEAINHRRKNLKLPPVKLAEEQGPSAKHGLVGIGLSGGGIRSSTFNLGLLQALDRKGMLKRVDYLSTVSGGGYIGSCLSAVLSGASEAQKTSDPFPFPFRHTPGRPESKAFKHLRDYASYLKPPRPLSGLRIPGLVLRGLLVNFLILLPLILLVVVATVLFAKNDIRDALNTRSFNYTIDHPGPAIPAAAAAGLSKGDYRRVTIDLRSQVQWAQHQGRLDLLATLPGGRAALLENQDLERPPASWPLGTRPGAADCALTAWPGDNRAYRFFKGLAGGADGQITWAHRLVHRLPALFDAHTYRVPDKAPDRPGDPVFEIDPGDYVGWKKYVMLSGLPKNAYSDSGKFLDGGRWLFDGRAARDLQLNMWIPDTHEEIEIDVRAWQTRDADYLTVQHPKQQIDLYYEAGQLKAETWSSHDLIKTAVDLGSQPLSAGLSLEAILRYCDFKWPDDGQDRYLLLANLAGEVRLAQGQWLLNGDWVFANQEMGALDSVLRPANLAAYDGDRPLRLIAWHSGLDKACFDPVTMLYNRTFDLTKWLLLVFGGLLALYPLIQKFAPVTGLSAWRRRDILTRYLCGGGIAVVAVIAFLEIQPLAIYLFYRLKEILETAGIVGSADKVLAVLGSLSVAAGGIFSSKALGQGHKLATKLGLYAMGIIGPGVLWLFYLNLCGWALNPGNIPAMLAGIQGNVLPLFVLLAVVLLAVTRIFFNVNQTSFHPFYRDRLSKAFIFTIDDRTGRVAHDDTRKLHTLETDCAPYHLINTTLNISGRGEINLQGRNADFFLFSRDYVGSQTTGYCRTRTYESKDKHMGLATAMAISGAAAAPNMGRMTQKSLVFIMTLLNIRLGYWARNPQWVHRRWGCSRVGPGYLIKEMLGLVNEKSGCLNVSDGGHLENMGLYELVRRRCRFIIIGDAEADKQMTFKGLAEAIRMIRIDMGISIDIDLDAIYRKDGQGQRHFAMGTIHYDDGETGRLLYVKSSVSKTHNPYIEDYMARHPDFPHESTADQFFDEAQFEAYRALGADVGEKVLEDPLSKGFVDGVIPDPKKTIIEEKRDQEGRS